jgi:hypothetical protein
MVTPAGRHGLGSDGGSDVAAAGGAGAAGDDTDAADTSSSPSDADVKKVAAMKTTRAARAAGRQTVAVVRPGAGAGAGAAGLRGVGTAASGDASGKPLGKKAQRKLEEQVGELNGMEWRGEQKHDRLLTRLPAYLHACLLL